MQNKKLLMVMLFIVLLGNVYADAGLTTGERILDQGSSLSNTAYNSAIEIGNFFTTGAIGGIKIVSTAANTLARQFQNKEQAGNQNTDIDIAKRNLQNSKDNVGTMFFFIVATFVVFFDMLVSMIYILLMLFFIWLIFTGYAKFMIIIIDWISGRIERRGMRK